MADNTNGQELDVGSVGKAEVGMKLGFGIPGMGVAEAQRGRLGEMKDRSCLHSSEQRPGLPHFIFTPT